MISGDALANGNIDNKSKNDSWVNEMGLSGYYNGDFNLDGTVDVTDKNNYWIPNTGKGSQIP
jgi:hypothetical protein